MMTIKAIETRYAGYHFRSRLEARWAVFFDTLGIEWLYEPERFKIEGGGSYLPDFYLPESQTWVEVKGDLAALDWGYISRICDYESPLPGVKDSLGTTRGLLLLGPIPRVKRGGAWNHALVHHSKSLHISHSIFIGSHNWDRPTGRSPSLLAFGNTAHRYKVQGSKMLTGPGFNTHCAELLPDCGWSRFSCEGNPPIDILKGHKNYGFQNNELSDAYEAARSARFEHGQSGARR